ncbi:hypothetical protein OIU77_008382 [Salix suchowensis]|uniref:Uncharacterized protein n=1 Tax=Salix suchowensis TaxID=1278906 RepID=A0ABQ9AL90_9ROSI|nr:hypothetical protein OIU77_008382 [Salix suchowensis]
MMFMKCANPVKSPLYVDTAPCINGTNSYVLVVANFSYVENLCKVELIAMKRKVLPPKRRFFLSHRKYFSPNNHPNHITLVVHIDDDW